MKKVVNAFEWLRKKTGLQSHYLETTIVALILIVTAISAGSGWIEWVGVAGVILTFEYQVLSTYLREHAEARERRGKTSKTDALSKEIQFLYYGKECVWIAYFLVLGAYSALVGTFLFIFYGVWRRTYRKEIHLSDDDVV